jgi:hypothetical protein
VTCRSFVTSAGVANKIKGLLDNCLNKSSQRNAVGRLWEDCNRTRKTEASATDPEIFSWAIARTKTMVPMTCLVELKTLQGPLRFKSVALKLAAAIAEEAQKLAPDRSAN